MRLNIALRVKEFPSSRKNLSLSKRLKLCFNSLKPCLLDKYILWSKYDKKTWQSKGLQCVGDSKWEGEEYALNPIRVGIFGWVLLADFLCAELCFGIFIPITYRGTHPNFRA